MMVPYDDMIADFIVHSDYRKKFRSPLEILHTSDSNKFSLISSLAAWLEIDPAKIELVPKRVSPGLNQDPIGMFEMLSDGGARITYSVNINLCWRRFVIVKELVHLILNKLEYTSYSPEIDTRELLASVCYPQSCNMVANYDISTSRGTNELVAWFFACQLLVPWFEHERVINSDESNNDLALKYRAPLVLIESIKDKNHMHVTLAASIKAAVERRKSPVPAS